MREDAATYSVLHTGCARDEGLPRFRSRAPNSRRLHGPLLSLNRFEYITQRMHVRESQHCDDAPENARESEELHPHAVSRR